MKRNWSNEEVDEITLGIWSYHIGGEAAKWSKKYSDNFDKALRLVQQMVIQRR